MCVATEFASTPDWESAKTIVSVGISTVCLKLALADSQSGVEANSVATHISSSSPRYSFYHYPGSDLKLASNVTDPSQPSQRMTTSLRNNLPVVPTHHPAGVEANSVATHISSSSPRYSFYHYPGSDVVIFVSHTFFSILSPSCSATVIAFLRELACSIRSLIEDPLPVWSRGELCRHAHFLFFAALLFLSLPRIRCRDICHPQHGHAYLFLDLESFLLSNCDSISPRAGVQHTLG
jgi:hypothetical protein